MKLKSIDKSYPHGHLAHSWTVSDVSEVYERQLGTSPQEVRDQEERVHERAGELAHASFASKQSEEPQIEGETVKLHAHDSEDMNQDQIHKLASLHLWRGI